ncbi:hypothetical protein QJU00_23890, partial [Bordetella bronchiseptica]
MTTATLPIPALTPAPGPAAQGGPAAAGKGPSFSQVLARQQGGKPGEAGTPAAPGAQAGAPAQARFAGRTLFPHSMNRTFSRDETRRSAALLAEAARSEVLPRFRHLTEDAVR